MNTLIEPKPPREETHDLFLGDKVLTVGIDPFHMGFRPADEQCDAINQMILGLSRAGKSVIYQADNDKTSEYWMHMEPMEAILDSIVLLAQTSHAIRKSLP